MPLAYSDTFYSRTATGDGRAPLNARLDVEVCIIGGGLAGLTTALELVRAGRSVALLEAQRFAWGASGRNGGFVSAGYATSLASIARRVGLDQAKELFRLSLEGVDIVRRNIADLGIDDASPVDGIYKAVRYDSRGSLSRSAEEMRRDFGLDLTHVPGEDLRHVLLTSKYREAVLDRDAFHFHPMNYARALASEAERLGARLFEGSPVTSVDLGAAQKRVRTETGEIVAGDVVFATGGYTGALLPALHRAFLPIATYVLLTEAKPSLVESAIQTRAAVLDDRRAGDYYRIVDDGARILWGGRITTRTSDPRDLAERLRREMVATYPQLRGLGVEVAWSGLMSYARHLMPQIGRHAPGVWYGTAFGGHGMNTTALAGRLLAEAIAGRGDRYRLFEPFGLAWNGGPLGRVAAQLTYWGYQVSDSLRERRTKPLRV
ncbi:NAD(P)/FAD-dependent oxidoreductase [Microvirga pudoricolor]|uniref:NAD(P)/FAD-dependent oxidoreductase n=1 Tax=Microvirga pudoricolor TaxID=2778729 RepID=UPI00194E7100|nr:FAD-binding oxidoreductase [Microvirga pudoricolor]MBM6596722.1 FAD-binding oxidoreductase [Microvirga pudoricolor]